MFKCKQCGRQFGANIPDSCPDCGLTVPQPTDTHRLFPLLVLDSIVELLFLVLIGLAIAALIYWLF